MASDFKVNLQAAQDSVKQQMKDAVKKAAKPAPKPEVKTASLAQPTLVTSQTLNPPRGMGKQKFQRVKQKLSAEEAKSGIAAAMQGMEQAATARPDAKAIKVTVKKSKVAWPAPVPATVPYKGPNGETWSGRGLKPKWVQVHTERGGQLEDLKVAA